MTEQSPSRHRQFVNVLDSLANLETDNMRWLRLASEKLERDRALNKEGIDRE